MSEQYFLVRKLGLGKEVVSLSLVVTEVSRAGGMRWDFINFVPYVWLRNIYYDYVRPYLMYGIEIYANTYVTYLDKLVKINNKLLRILQNQPLATPVSQLYTSFNLLSIGKLHMLHILLLVFKCFTIVIWFHQYILIILY